MFDNKLRARGVANAPDYSPRLRPTDAIAEAASRSPRHFRLAGDDLRFEEAYPATEEHREDHAPDRAYTSPSSSPFPRKQKIESR